MQSDDRVWQDMRSRCAVIVLNYFAADDTSACVCSVRGNFPGNVVYLVDNSADAAERERLEGLFAGAADVKMLFPPGNLGFAAGVNLALDEAVADGFGRFLVLNNDAELLEGAGSVLDRAFEEHPASLVAPVIAWGDGLCRGNYYHKYLGLITGRPLCPGDGFVFYLTGCALAFDRAALDRAGRFDESFFMYGEDVEYCERARRNGVPVVLLDEVIVSHAGSRSARRGSFFYEYHVSRGHLLLTFRLAGSPLGAAVMVLPKVAVLIARAMFRALRYRSPAPLAALCLAPFPLPVRPRG